MNVESETPLRGRGEEHHIGGEALSRVEGWTLPTIEVDEFLQIEEGKVVHPIEKEVWITPLAEICRIRADSQNEEGVELGYYPEGFILKGAYIYNPSSELKISRRRYKPSIALDPHEALQNYFPRSAELMEFANLVETGGGMKLPQIEGSVASQSWRIAEAWSQIGQGYFSDEFVKGYSRIETHLGWPVVIFERPEDLYRYQPYPSYRVPENVQAVSFVATPLSSPKPGEILEDTPFIACIEGCPAEVMVQHIRTQLVFAQAVARSELTPVLISRRPTTYQEKLEMTIKEHALTLAIREKAAVPLNWQESLIVKHAVSQAKSELFEVRHRQSPVKRPYYIGERPDRYEFGPDHENNIQDWLDKKMKKAFASLNEADAEAADHESAMARARELWLCRVNLFSFFPLSEWPMVADLANRWEGRVEFRKSYKIPWEILHSNSRERGEDIPVTDQTNGPTNSEVEDSVAEPLQANQPPTEVEGTSQ